MLSIVGRFVARFQNIARGFAAWDSTWSRLGFVRGRRIFGASYVAMSKHPLNSWLSVVRLKVPVHAISLMEV